MGSRLVSAAEDAASYDDVLSLHPRYEKALFTRQLRHVWCLALAGLGVRALKLLHWAKILLCCMCWLALRGCISTRTVFCDGSGTAAWPHRGRADLVGHV
jgi:hypothetical protein